MARVPRRKQVFGIDMKTCLDVRSGVRSRSASSCPRVGRRRPLRADHYHGASHEEVLQDSPYLEPEDIVAALEYAARQSDHPVLSVV